MFASLRKKFRDYVARNENEHALARLPVDLDDQLPDHFVVPIIFGPGEELARLVETGVHVLEIFNDEKTPMEYVSRIIEMYSRRKTAEAMELAMKIHFTGVGMVVAGSSGTLELIAKLIDADAKFREFPLRCAVRAV